MPNITQKQVEALTNDELIKLLEEHINCKYQRIFHELVRSKVRELALNAFTCAKTNILSYDDIINYIGKTCNKLKKDLPKIDDLVISSFSNYKKNTLTYGEIEDYVNKFPVNHDFVVKTLRKCITDKKIVKIEMAGEKRAYMGHLYQLV